ncbi:hypothetical protein KEM54_000426 [Ascosphaera aggregata]|nr:hypothetical protein KEM54_000426 [Ascosphaera aggregata]
MAAEKARADKLAVDKAKAEKIAAEKAKAHQAAIQKAQAQKAAAEKAKAQRVAADKARGGQANGEKAAAAKVHEGQPGKAVTEDEDQFKDDSFVDKSLREQSRYYAVKYGFNPGIYYHWTDCQAQIEGYESPIFKAFDSLVEADQFMRAPGPKPWSPPLTKAKYYAVQQGKVPGVYTSWTEAREQVLDYPEPKYRKFNSFDEAEEFVKLNEAYIPPSGECDLTDEVPVASISGQAASPVAYQFQTCQNNNTVEIVTPAFTLRVTPHVEAPSVGGSAVAADRVLNRAAATPKPAEQVADKSSYTLPDQRVIAGSRKKEVPVSTDGACSGNGKVSGRAGIGVYFGPGDLRNIAEPLPGSRQTSARAELAAIARALELVRRDSNVAVFSDSKYAVNCLTNWYVGWQRNNWMTSDGRPVENKDIIQNILQKIEEREKLSASTRFEWVRGHNRNKWNEMADKLANDGVKKSFTLQ